MTDFSTKNRARPRRQASVIRRTSAAPLTSAGLTACAISSDMKPGVAPDCGLWGDLWAGADRGDPSAFRPPVPEGTLIKRLPDFPSREALEHGPHDRRGTTGPFTLPPAPVFVPGDNRDNRDNAAAGRFALNAGGTGGVPIGDILAPVARIGAR